MLLVPLLSLAKILAAEDDMAQSHYMGGAWGIFLHRVGDRVCGVKSLCRCIDPLHITLYFIRTAEAALVNQ